jgi:Ni/Fe-hydrogenase subunit HybB-like protein
LALGRALEVGLILYAVIRFEDLYHRGALSYLRHPGYESSLFLVEVVLGLLLPISLLLSRKIRESADGLYLAAVLVIMGFVANRLNVSVTGLESFAGVHYVPKWTEVAITGSIVAAGFVLFGAATKYLPIFPAEEKHVPIPQSLTVLSSAERLGD